MQFFVIRQVFWKFSTQLLSFWYFRGDIWKSKKKFAKRFEAVTLK